jgi:hypothetical protein
MAVIAFSAIGLAAPRNANELLAGTTILAGLLGGLIAVWFYGKGASPNHKFGFRVAAGGAGGLPIIAAESPTGTTAG